MSKLLLALQFWDGDKSQAMEVARLIADLEPKRREDVDFLFVSRFDCAHDVETIKHVGEKFSVHSWVNRNRRGVGWPSGCNDLWFGTMDWVYTFSEAKRTPGYKAVLTFEADSSPLTPNWISRLSSIWDQSQPACCVGALQTAPAEHINGNAMFSGDPKFLYWLTREVIGCSPHGGWDFLLASEFKRRGWADSPAMRSYWGSKSMTDPQIGELESKGVVFLHGVKDDSVLKSVRKRFIH